MLFRSLGVDHAEFDRLALAGEPGAGGIVEVPYFGGERTPNLPSATGHLAGLTLANLTRENVARAAAEGLLCLMAYGIEAQRALGVRIDRVTLIGGGARSGSVRALAPGVLGVPVDVPEPGEYVALGAARQAAWVVAGGDAPPVWSASDVEHVTGDPRPGIFERYTRVAERLYPTLA